MCPRNVLHRCRNIRSWAGYVRADAGDRLLAYEGLRLSFTFVIRRVMRCGFVVIGGVSEVR